MFRYTSIQMFITTNIIALWVLGNIILCTQPIEAIQCSYFIMYGGLNLPVHILYYPFVSSICFHPVETFSPGVKRFHPVWSVSTWFEAFPLGLKSSHLVWNLPTRVETFPPGWKPFHMVWNLATRMETFPPGWKPFHLVGNLSTWLDTIPPGWTPFHLVWHHST